MAKKNYTKKELEKAIVDILDGSSSWYDIRDSTGLPEERCHELSAMFAVLVKKYYP